MEYVYVFAFRSGQLLLVKNRKRGWEAPGGKIEQGETPKEAALREFKEETGRSLKILCYEFFNGGHVFYGIAGEVEGKVLDEAIEVAEFFEKLPCQLAFSEEEYRELIRRGHRCMRSKGKRLNPTS